MPVFKLLEGFVRNLRNYIEEKAYLIDGFPFGRLKVVKRN